MANKSLFLQVASADPSQIVIWFNHVRNHHKDPNKDGYIYNIVLNEIGDKDGAWINTTKLDAIQPYLPGGAERTFDNVFVGSAFNNTNQNDPYGYGMVESSHRWTNLKTQRQLWDMYDERYPDRLWHFYIDHEGVLDYWDVASIRDAYSAYLLQSIKDAHDIQPNRAVLWSPAAWEGTPFSYWERRAIRTKFKRIRDAANAYGWNGGLWIALQDMRGRDRDDISLTDVRAWYRQLKAAHAFDSLGINMEMFATRPGYYGPGDPDEIANREDWYQSQGMPISASWEIRFWYETHRCEL